MVRIKELKAKNCIPNYEKTHDYFDILFPLMQKALDRAKSLQKHHKDNGLSMFHRDSNPCTTVAQLVELLQTGADKP